MWEVRTESNKGDGPEAAALFIALGPDTLCFRDRVAGKLGLGDSCGLASKKVVLICSFSSHPSNTRHQILGTSNEEHFL